MDAKIPYKSHFESSSLNNENSEGKTINKDLNKSSDWIDSGICVESLNSISSSSYLSSSSCKNIKEIDNHNKNNKSNKFNTNINSMLDSSESTDLHEYNFKEQQQDDELEEDANDQQVDKTKLDELDEKHFDFVFNLFQTHLNENQFETLSNFEPLLQDKNGNTLLHLAILKEKTQLALNIIKSLSHPDYLNIRNNSLQTPLHLACLTQQIKITRYLIICGATLDIFDLNGDLSLHIACKLGDQNLIKQFLNPISLKEIEGLNLKYKIYIKNCQYHLLKIRNFEGDNCLLIATQTGDLDLIKYLIDCGSDVRSQDLKNGYSILHLAVKNQKIEILRYLLDKHIFLINQLNYAQQNALDLALEMVDFNLNNRQVCLIIQLLEQKGSESHNFCLSDSEEDSNSESSYSLDEMTD